ncbi:MAG: FAD-dependent oxidoreductase, partial [Acholeplasmataceae bacterium]|nr:FAD-dependent oxidoreductase [Acholeplasmataceae bacterium]
MYDIIVVGGGHAGIEAALATARLNKKTLLVTGSLNRVGFMSCNPSIGGPAKGVVVREIDALGGQMAKIADLTQIQMKMLNRSKGPAVWALRAQIDKQEYPKAMLKVLQTQENLELKEALVENMIVEDNTIKGITLQDKTELYAKAVIITTGTYLASKVLKGHDVIKSGPDK